MRKAKKLTAIYTDENGERKMMEHEDYNTKKAFAEDLRKNGYRYVLVYTEEDLKAREKGFRSASDMKKRKHQNELKERRAEEAEKKYQTELEAKYGEV